MTILGIDPGTAVLGYAVLEHGPKGKASCIAMGVLTQKKESDMMQRATIIMHSIRDWIVQYKVDVLAIEDAFFGQNVQSMLKLGRTQGIIIAAAISSDIPTYLYSPRKVKQAVCGNGAASKEQVADMLPRLLTLPAGPHKLDATDALAIALCHQMQGSNLSHSSSKRQNSWTAFLESNPEKGSGSSIAKKQSKKQG